MSQTNFTYTQIIKLFQDFASRHKQIRSFAYGEPYEMASSGDNIYPALWLNPIPGNIQGNQLNLKFYLIIADIAAQDLTDTAKVQSDTLTILLDCKTYFQKEFLFDLEIDETNIPITPFVERTGDNLAGWNMQLTLNLENYSDLCSVGDLMS